MPEFVDVEFLSNYIDDTNDLNIPVGVETETLEISKYNFSKNYINFVYSSGDESVNYLKDFIGFEANIYKHSGWIFDIGRKINTTYKNYVNANTSKICEEQIDEVYNIVLKRNNEYKMAKINAFRTQKG